MAERSSSKKARPSQPVVSLKRLSSSSGAERSKRIEVRLRVKSASGPAKMHTDDLYAKEEKYKLMNAELEAKTADLVGQAEQLMRKQSEVLSKPLSSLLLKDIENEEGTRVNPHQCTVRDPDVKVVTKNKVTSASQNSCTGKQGKESHFETLDPKVFPMKDLAAVEESADFFLAKTIFSTEKMMNDTITHDSVVDDVSNSGDCIEKDAQIRFLKAKLQIMQEELDQILREYNEKDDENAKLNAKIKEIEVDRARLQKTTSIQLTQIEKHRALADSSGRKCDGLQLQLSALNKKIEDLNRSHKQAAAAHSSVEVRLNRALEEVERLKTQLSKMKQINQDKVSEELQGKENLLAENKILKKQKEELIVGFKKQLKLIDILKRQKMHFEAAKMLSFTEDEFMKALDWGKS